MTESGMHTSQEVDISNILILVSDTNRQQGTAKRAGNTHKTTQKQDKETSRLLAPYTSQRAPYFCRSHPSSTLPPLKPGTAALNPARLGVIYGRAPSCCPPSMLRCSSRRGGNSWGGTEKGGGAKGSGKGAKVVEGWVEWEDGKAGGGGYKMK